MAEYVTIPPLDPNKLNDTSVRMLAGVAKLRPVVLDTDMGFNKWIQATGTGGLVTAVDWEGVTVTFYALQGALLPIFTKKINASGTTALSLVVGA